MPSPFPGMDPYLESSSRWANVQHHLLASMQQALMLSVADRYRARLASRTYTVEVPLFTSISREEHSEEFLEVRSRADGQLVTQIEVITIGQRTTTIGRQMYRAARQAALSQRATIIEIDLLTQGTRPIDLPGGNTLPTPYSIVITPSTNSERQEIIPLSIEKRLPRFRFPVAPDERELMVDLQAVFSRAYDLGGFGVGLDYRGPLPAEVRLSPEAQAWVEEWLRTQGHPTPN